MYTRQKTNHAFYWSDLSERPAINSFPLIKNHLSYHLLFQRMYRFTNLRPHVRVSFVQSILDLIVCLSSFLLPQHFVGCRDDILEQGGPHLIDFFPQFLIDSFCCNDPFCFADLILKLFLHIKHGLHSFVSEKNCLNHIRL